MKMFLISDNIDTYTGMRLAGVEGVVVHERKELRSGLWRTPLPTRKTASSCSTEKFGREFPDIIDDMRLNHRLPLIIEIPDRHGYRPCTRFYSLLCQ